MWVRGHAGTHGNEEADALAREGAGLRFHGPEPAVGVPPVLVRNAIREKAKENHRILWQQTLSCRQCKEFGVDLETKRAKNLVRLSRQNVRASICLLRVEFAIKAQNGGTRHKMRLKTLYKALGRISSYPQPFRSYGQKTEIGPIKPQK